MAEEYFVYIDKLQHQEEEARRQKEQVYIQMRTAYENLKKDNTQQNRLIVELQKRIQEAEMNANLLSQENLKLKDNAARMQIELEKALTQLAENEAYKQSGFPYVLVEHNFDETKEYKKKEKKLEDKIKELQEKLGKKSVSLSVLAEGIMDYAEEAGISEAHELFNHLNNLLINVPAWTNNVPELKKFFKKARKEIQGYLIPPINNHGQVNILTGKDAQAPYNPKEDDSE